MFAPTSSPRPESAPVRWRYVWAWGAFFALVIAGVVLFWIFLDGSPVMHRVAPR